MPRKAIKVPDSTSGGHNELLHCNNGMKKEPKSLRTDPALQALRDAVGKVIQDHRSRGRPLALWRDGKAVWVAVDQLGAGEKLGRSAAAPHSRRQPRMH